MNNIIYIGGNKKMLTELTNQNYYELISADLAKRYDVTALPTLLFIKNGDIKNKLEGFTHKLIILDNIKRL